MLIWSQVQIVCVDTHFVSPEVLLIDGCAFERPGDVSSWVNLNHENFITAENLIKSENIIL